MNKSQRGSGRVPTEGKAVFYKQSQAVEEVRAGYLFKSPPSKLFKTEKSWKRRYFVLFKKSEKEHQLKYFRSAENKEKPLGEIDLLQNLELSMCPENHPMFGLIQKYFKCSPSSVLYIKSVGREYFLVGENSSEMENWFSAICHALENRSHGVDTGVKNGSMKTEENVYSDMTPTSAIIREMPEKPRALSDPPPNMRSYSFCETGMQCIDRPRRLSEPLNPIYDYPKSFLKNLQDEFDTSATRDNDKDQSFEDESSHYMSMDKITCTKVIVTTDEEQAQETDNEVAEYCDGTLMRSMAHVFDERENEVYTRSAEASSDLSKSSSDNEAVSPAEVLQELKPCAFLAINKLPDTTSVRPDDRNTEKIDVEIHLEDLKKHLKVMEIDGKPCVSGWTGHQQRLYLFHKGDQILAINDIQNCSRDEYYFLLSRILKDQVKLTMVRLHGGQPLSAN